MADLLQRLETNATGKYYVDESCTNCASCREIAPDHFLFNEDSKQSFVALQPRTPDEDELCEEAMDNCPMESVGEDGEDAGVKSDGPF